MATKRPNIGEFKKICRVYDGIISGIASYFKVERQTVYNWCKNEKYQQALDDAKENFLDIAETRLQTLIKGIPKVEKNETGQSVQVGWEVPPDNASIFFFLKTKGKKRGFSERQEIDMNASIDMKAGITMEDFIKERFKGKK